MKAIIKFDLNEEMSDFKDFMSATDMKLVLWQFDQYLRGECKYMDNEAACAIREKLYDILNEYGVNIDE